MLLPLALIVHLANPITWTTRSFDGHLQMIRSSCSHRSRTASGLQVEMVRLSRRTVAGECNRQNVLPSSTLGDFLLHRNQVLALSTLNTNFVGGVESKKEDRIGISLIHVTPDDFMTVAGLRCAAFTGGADHQRFIDNRFALFQASKTRHELGNIIIAARCNLSLLSLELIAKSAELRTEKDKLAYDQMNDLNQKVSAGDVEKCDVLQKREEILHEWRLGRNGKGPIVGAVDLSTHEFEMSAVWMREMQDQRRKDVYLSEMAVHPNFSGLGIGQRIIQEAVHVSRAKKYTAIHLHVSEQNARARSFYELAGFEAIEEGVAHIDFSRVLCFDPNSPKETHMTKELSS